MKLGEISVSIKDGDWIEKKDQSLYGFRLIQTGNIGVGLFKNKAESARYISEETFSRLHCEEVFEGNILISRLPDPVGRACIVPHLDTRNITAVDCSIVKLNSKIINSDYFILYTQSNKYFNKVSSLSTGTTRQRITRKKLAELQIPVPPLPEQQRIVSYLDAQFAKIDQLKKNAERQLQAAKDLWQKALNEMLEPKDLWDRKELKDLCTHIIDCPHTTPKKSENKTNFPCIRTSELKNGSIYWESMQYLEESEYLKRISRLIPQADDIVYGREGTFGDAVLLPQGYKFCLGQRTMLLRPNKDIISPNFLHYAIISPLVYNQAQEKNSGCGVPHVNVADVKKFKISFPKSLCEQKKITTQLDELSLRCKLLESNYNTTITLCNDLKQSLLKQIFE